MNIENGTSKEIKKGKNILGNSFLIALLYLLYLVILIEVNGNLGVGYTIGTGIGYLFSPTVIARLLHFYRKFNEAELLSVMAILAIIFFILVQIGLSILVNLISVIAFVWLIGKWIFSMFKKNKIAYHG